MSRFYYSYLAIGCLFAGVNYRKNMNMNIKIGILFCCLIITSNYIFAQSETKKIKSEKFFEIGASLNYINLSNPRHSVVSYNGLGRSVNIGLQFEKETKREGFYLNYLKGNLTSKNKLNNTGIFHVKLGYYLEKKIKSISEKITWYLGGDFSTFLNMRTNLSLGNNQMFYDFVQDLRISTSIRKKLIYKDRPLYLNFRLKIPLIALVSRPPKSIFIKDEETENGMPTSDNLTNTMFTNGKVSFVGKYSTIQSEITVWRPFKKNRNRVGLSYIWDLYTYRDFFDKKQVMATHSIKLILLTNL